jgi:pyruvate formate-lyase activating enzyme-like uncharacterized protein
VSAGVSEYYDVQRQLTIEKGEDRYYHLYSKKKREYQGNINSQFKKQLIAEKLNYF